MKNNGKEYLGPFELGRVHHADCIDALKLLPDKSVDCVITDPPYGLKFMGKKWDYAVPRKEAWEEILRVCKPGTHAFIFGGSRTFHRMACEVEDAGWEIRDTIMWLYGSGFPKSLNIGKAVDKMVGAERKIVGKYQLPNGSKWNLKQADNPKIDHAGSIFIGSGVRTLDITAPATPLACEWEGWGTALKPAFEPIIIARKPFEGTVVQNILKHGTGAINIDISRIPPHINGGKQENLGRPVLQTQSWCNASKAGVGSVTDDWKMGRFPANIIHDGSEEVVGLFPHTKSVRSQRGKVEIFKKEKSWIGESSERGHNDSGSAARFFYCAKASKGERGKGNNHPTVKPLALMEYLVKMGSKENARVLDPFSGSGTTGVACAQLGRRFLGFEIGADYCRLANDRIAAAHRGQTLTQYRQGQEILDFGEI